MTLDFEDILAAQARLEGHIERTPCRHSRTLSEITGAEVWVKFENHQFTAAYKERGALNKLLLLGENVRSRGVIAASAGNHSQGLSYHAARLGIPVTIVMPKGTPFVKVQQTRAHGAEVLIEGDSYAEASSIPSTTWTSWPARAPWRSRCCRMCPTWRSCPSPSAAAA